MRTVVSPGAWPGLSFAAPVGGGSGIGPQLGVSGTVTLSGGAGGPVAGGTIQLIRSSAVVASAVPNASGIYTFPSVQPGDTVYNQPPLAYSIADAGSFTVNPGDVKNFSVQAAVGYANCTNLSTDAGVWSETVPPVSDSFWKNYTSAGIDSIASPLNNGTITANLTGGSSGGKCMQYHWNSRPTCPGGNPGACGSTLCTQARIVVPGSPTDLWVRCRNKFSSGFRIGGGGASGSQAEYKFIILAFTGGSAGDLELMLDNPNAGAVSDDITVRLVQEGIVTQRSDGSPGYVPQDYHPAAGSLLDVWDTWVIHMSGFGTTSVVTELYRNGSVVLTLPAGNFLGSGIFPGQSIYAVGTQINNGPDAAQDRYVEEFAVYTTRPSLLNALAV